LQAVYLSYKKVTIAGQDSKIIMPGAFVTGKRKITNIKNFIK
jgi:hypothetical protein